MEKVWIEKLPETMEIDGAKRWTEEKGEFAQISFGEEIRHLAYFELKKGFWRGSHFHKEKEETFYIVSGSMRGVCIDMDSGTREEFFVGRGDKVHILPRCAHIFYGTEDAVVVEYSPQRYVKEDTVKVEFTEGS